MVFRNRKDRKVGHPDYLEGGFSPEDPIHGAMPPEAQDNRFRRNFLGPLHDSWPGRTGFHCDGPSGPGPRDIYYLILDFMSQCVLPGLVQFQLG